MSKDTFLTEIKKLRMLRAHIQRIKVNLIKKAQKSGIYENFGQKEVRLLRQEYGDYKRIDNFNDWCVNYDGSL